MLKDPSVSLFVRARVPVWTEVTLTDAPETGVPATVVKRPETCPYTDWAVLLSVSSKTLERSNITRMRFEALILPPFEILYSF
jgi:hypothetical protein